MMTDITHILGKPFRPGGRGPGSYDCVGVAVEVVRIEVGDEAADTMPGGEMTTIEPEDFPGEWRAIGVIPGEASPGDVVLTERTNTNGDTEHHLYVATSIGRFATSDRKRGVIVVPLRAIQEHVVGVYRWERSR